MKNCTKCILPDTFPGINFDMNGICNFCRDFKGREYLNQKKEEYKLKFDALVKEYRSKSDYDALMCYSGGKDSTFTLSILKEKYNLNILAVTFDNGFIPNQTFANIRKVVEYLGIDHIFFKPSFDVLKEIFRICAEQDIYPHKTLERASTICTSCMGIVKFSALRIALDKNIPFIIFGWSPGQAPITSSIMKNNHQMIQITQKAIFDPLYKKVGEVIKPYFLEKKYFKGDYHFPYNIHPLAFLNYDEEKVVQEISKIGWIAPQDTDSNSTNCLLNSFGNIVHKKRWHFHPYAFEIASLVRQGYMDRAKALEKINKKEDIKIVNLARKKLEI